MRVLARSRDGLNVALVGKSVVVWVAGTDVLNNIHNGNACSRLVLRDRRDMVTDARAKLWTGSAGIGNESVRKDGTLMPWCGETVTICNLCKERH